MLAVLPGKPQAKLQALCTAHWEGVRILAYISGNALVLLTGAQKLLQTIYIDDAEELEAVAIEETSGKIATCARDKAWVYAANGKDKGNLRWSLAQAICFEESKETIHTISWGSPDELLLGNSHLTLYSLDDSPTVIWYAKLANPAKLAQFSYDGSLIASCGQYDRLAKIWRRLAFNSDDIQFDVSYLSHPATVTEIHWRRPQHPGQVVENVLFTICADHKIRIWAATDHHVLQVLQLWTEIDMETVIQPRRPSVTSMGPERRYGFFINSRDFCGATERAVQKSMGSDKANHALEHLIDIATRTPEICVVLDGRGHMSAWGLENVGCKSRKEENVFNIAHVEGLHFSFRRNTSVEEDFTCFYNFCGGITEDSFTLLAHYFDGRIEWYDGQVDELFDPSPRPKRLTLKATWSGHAGPIKKIVRNNSGRASVSRTNDNEGLVWKQRRTATGPALTRQSKYATKDHIHRMCLLGEGEFLVLLHHDYISLWDTRSFKAAKIAACDYKLSAKALCLLLLPTEAQHKCIYVAAISADMKGIAWEITLPSEGDMNGFKENEHITMRQFSTFDLGVDEGVAFVLPVDPAGSLATLTEFLDTFAIDVAISYTKDGVLQSWTAKVDHQNQKLDWLLTSTIETGIENPSLASGSSIRKTALIDANETSLTIWDTRGAQLEYEEVFTDQDIVQDLDWTSTPDVQSILAVGFPHRVLLLSQLRFDYLSEGPSWAPIREISIHGLTPHPIGDSCWLGHGNLLVGAGNQLFVYDQSIESTDRFVKKFRLASDRMGSLELFNIVTRLNGTLPVFHPQFLAQCILSGKTDLVHAILLKLHKKLKFFTEGDEIDGFLDMPLQDFFSEKDEMNTFAFKEMHSSFANFSFSFDTDPDTVDETVAATLNQNLMKVALPQLSSQQQFHLADMIECVALVEKHRRSMDDNAARYLLFFRQHMLRRSQGPAERITISWREIVWAFHSGSQDILVDLVSRQFQGKMLWEHARESGIFMWMTDTNALKAQVEIIARNEYTKSDEKNPIDCSLYYLALQKKNVLQGLWRIASWNREQASTSRLLANNFNDARWKTAALKNAYALLSKRRFEYAAAFFLLASEPRSAATVCLNQMADPQLAITILRCYSGDDSPLLAEFLTEHILPEAAAAGNRWLATWAFWMLNKRDLAVRALISPIYTLMETPESPGLQAKSYLSNDPALVVLYKQLREKTVMTLRGASKIHPRKEWEFLVRNAGLYMRMGCDLLALELVRNWEFLLPIPTASQNRRPSLHRKSSSVIDEVGVDPRKMLRRRSSLVVSDMPLSPTMGSPEMKAHGPGHGPHEMHSGGAKPAPTVFEEPDTGSLLDSFGF